MREESDKLLEYIDGIVYMAPSPSTKHQRISNRLQIKMGIYLQGKIRIRECINLFLEISSEKIRLVLKEN